MVKFKYEILHYSEQDGPCTDFGVIEAESREIAEEILAELLKEYDDAEACGELSENAP